MDALTDLLLVSCHLRDLSPLNALSRLSTLVIEQNPDADLSSIGDLIPRLSDFRY